jgi:hypothetical protein
MKRKNKIKIKFSRRCPNGSKGKIETHLRRAWEAITPTYYKCDQYRAPPPFNDEEVVASYF